MPHALESPVVAADDACPSPRSNGPSLRAAPALLASPGRRPWRTCSETAAGPAAPAPMVYRVKHCARRVDGDTAAWEGERRDSVDTLEWRDRCLPRWEGFRR